MNQTNLQINEENISDSLNQPLLELQSSHPQPAQRSPISFFFSELNNVVRGINKYSQQLDSQKLGELLSENNFSPDPLLQQLKIQKQSFIINLLQFKKDAKSISIVATLKLIFLGKFILIGLLKCVSVIFLFLVPIVMNSLTNEVRLFSDGGQYDKNLILLYSILLVIFSLFQAITDTQYSYQITKLEMKSKVFLIESIYKSSMSRKGKAQKKNKEDKSTDTMNLLNIDVDTIVNFFVSFHECWSLILKLIVGLTLLYLQMKSAVLFGFMTAVVLMILNFMVALKIGEYYEKGMVFKDRRMELIKEFVSFPKQIKYLKWESEWFHKISQCRDKEFSVVKGQKWLDSLCVLFWSITNTLISTITLFYFVYIEVNSNEIQNQNIFTMIYLFSLLTNPLNSLPWTVSGMLQAKTSFRRVDDYLREPNDFNEFQQQIENPKIPLTTFSEKKTLIKFKEAKLDWSKEPIQQLIGSESSKVFPREEGRNEPFSLEINKLSIKKGKLYFVVGPTSSGKTAFINSILRQMNLISGSVNFHYQGDFSYVPQTHWLCQTTLRNNITMDRQISFIGSNIAQENYLTALEGSQFMQDIIENYPHELDLFEVGPEASKLSGGQKQRLSICRALYNENELYVFDDIFSSLDPNISDRIFENSINSYLVQKKKKTVIVALNEAYFKRYLKYAQEVILIIGGQIITDQQKINKYINETILYQNLDEEQTNQKVLRISDTERNQILVNLQNNTTQQDDNPQLQTFKHTEHTMLSIKFYLGSLGTLNAVVITISLIMMQVSFNLYDTWLNSYVNNSPLFLIDDNFVATLLMITILDILIKTSRATTFAYGNLVQAKRIFDSMLSKVIFAFAGFFDKEDSGQILSRFSGDQNVIDQKFPFQLNILCNNVVNFFGTLCVLVYLKWILIIPSLVAIVLFYFIQQQYRPTSLPLRRLESQSSAALMTELNDQCKGVSVIVAFNKSHVYYDRLINLIKDNLRVSWTSRCMGLWLQVRLQGVALFIVIFILAITNLQTYFPDKGFQLPPSTLQLLLFYSLTKINLFRDLTLSLTTCENELISYERIRKYQTYNQEDLKEVVVPQIVVDDPKKPLIEFQDIWLDYANQPQHQSGVQQLGKIHYALKGVSFKIYHKQMVAFCGKTGSGKSSILSLIFQLYQPEKGKVLLFNDILDNLYQWRSMISVIPQSGFVFKGTVQENLAPEEEQSQLDKINQIIKDIPTDLDLSVHLEEGGKNISQGKRQVISFIRILLENADIICLDEATASVDIALEEWIISTLEGLCRQQNKTVITISHRLESLIRYDHIFYLEDGRIKEEGTFQELINNPNSGFNKLRSLNK